jgi:YidC/Oxa1 family membrane protein insertase
VAGALALPAVSSSHPFREPLEVTAVFSLFDDAVSVAYHAVVALAAALTPLAGGMAAAAAVVLCTIAVRLLLLPLSYHAIRGQACQARLAPQVQALRQRHAGHPDRLQRELTELYRREGTGMLTGCLPALLQLPLLSVIYRVFRSGTIGGRPSSLLGRSLLGAPLGSHWLGGAGLISTQGLVFLGLFALLAAAAFLAGRVSRTLGQTAQPAGAAGVVTRAVPYTTVAIAAVLPLAAGLYLLTSTAWSAAERAVFARRLAPARGPGSGPQDVRRRSRSA